MTFSVLRISNGTIHRIDILGKSFLHILRRIWYAAMSSLIITKHSFMVLQYRKTKIRVYKTRQTQEENRASFNAVVLGPELSFNIDLG